MVPTAPHQTNRAHAAARNVGDHTRRPQTAFHPSQVTAEVMPTNPIRRLRYPVEHTPWHARTLGLETHSLDHFVVLVERHALQIDLHSHTDLGAGLELHAEQVPSILGK